MTKTIDFIPGDAEIVISDRESPEFLKAANAVGDYLKALPLTVEQNDTLISLIIANVQVAEQSAFKRGVSFGTAIANEKQS